MKCSLTPLIADGNCFGGWDENVKNYTHQNKYTFIYYIHIFLLSPFDVVVGCCCRHSRLVCSHSAQAGF